MLLREVTMRWMVGLSVVLLLPSVADAGKKKKKKKEKQAAEAPLIALPCGYVPGEVHRYRYEKVTRKDLPTGATAHTVRYELGIEVVSFDGTTSVLDVTSGPMEIAGTDPNDPMQRALMEALSRHAAQGTLPVIRYAKNHATSEHSVLNIDEIMPVYDALTNEVVKAMQEAEPSAASIAENVMGSLMTPEYVTQKIDEDLYALVDYTCGELRPHATYETLLPNALGGDPFPAAGEITVSRRQDEVVVHLSETVDPASVSGLLEDILTMAGMPADSPELAEALRSMSVHIGTDLEIVTPVATGWPTTWRSRRDAKVFMNDQELPGGRTDTVQCARVDPG